MTFEKYANRFLNKATAVLELYANYILEKVHVCETVSAFQTDEHLRLPPEQTLMNPIENGTKWGHEYGNIWLSTQIIVPEEADGRILCAIPHINAVEILCFKNNKPAGIINSKNDFIGGNHSFMFVDGSAHKGESIKLDFECYAGHTCLGCSPYYDYDVDEGIIDQQSFNHTYEGIDLYIMNETVRDMVFDLSCAIQMAQLDSNNDLSRIAYQALRAAYPDLIQDFKQVSSEEVILSAQRISEALKPVFTKNGGDASRGNVTLVGHSHMDTAWLWPVSETIRKCARTYSQVLTLMDLYPNYRFMQSSALHLDWMRRYYPDIFEGIRQRVKEGRYEPNGGVWVECDCNITGGEAMVRQFLYGQRFTRKYLDYTSDAFWLPDTFGYNAAIPQIMQQCGVKYFYTTKLSWNDLNKFPAGTFIWKGIDGTSVISHLNSMYPMPDPKTLVNEYAVVTDPRTEPARLAAFGYGDGGGGPTWGMQEYIKRIEGQEGLPKTHMGTPSEFMHETEKNADLLPVCDGELYLELHRGTLTKMHEVKRNNRLAEIALRHYELAHILCDQSMDEKRDEYWQTLLKNQFHDILPGTCIPKVYETAIPEMAKLIDDMNADTEKCLKSLGEEKQDTVSAVNLLPFSRQEVVLIPGSCGIEDHISQTYTDLYGQPQTAIQVNLNALSAEVLTLTAPQNSPSAFTVNGKTITTPWYNVTLDDSGFIAQLFDKKANRNVENPEGAPLGTIFAGEDLPSDWDNWDIDDDSELKLLPVGKPVSFEVVSDGAIELRLRAEYKICRRSSAILDTIFYANSRRIDYEMKINWQDRHGLVKAGFDVDIRSAFVKNEIQFGHIDRPTTRNNDIESAKFEVCNHKWSDLSETHYGVALLNDCKYGMSALGSDMRLTLFKGGVRPDFKTDFGEHFMRYSLLPHEGAFNSENVVRPAYCFNDLPVMVPGCVKLPKLFDLDHSGIICEAVKPAEDVENAFVMRLYECERNHTNVHLTLCNPGKVYITNMLEEVQEELVPDKDGIFSLKFKPFEIKTILVER